MLINTTKDWKKCNKTGRYLNLFNHYLQDHGDVITSYINTGKLEQSKLAIYYAELFKEGSKQTNKKTVSFLEKLMFRLLVNGTDRVIQVNSDQIIKVKSFKNLVIRLEALGWVDVYQGFASKGGSRPMAVQLAIPQEELDQAWQVIQEREEEVFKELSKRK